MMHAAFTILAGLTAVLMMSGCATQQVSNGNFRVMTYNIHHAEGLDGKIDLVRIAKVITDSRADLVALQEVDRNAARTGNIDMPAELARLTGLKVAFGANIPLQGGEYGNAILSRFPFEVVTNHHLPQIVPGEQRGMLQVLIHGPKGKFTFCATHLDHRAPEEDRLASADYIVKAFPRKSPVIIAGDFNAVPESETYQKLRHAFTDAWRGRKRGFTIPAESPRHRIDYIFSRVFFPERVQVLKSDASDHLPVIAEFFDPLDLLDKVFVCPAPAPQSETQFKFIDAKRNSFQSSLPSPIEE